MKASIRRSLGVNGTRLAAFLGEDEAGFIEVELLGDGERLSRPGGWADVGNLVAHEQHRRHEVAGYLIEEAASWLRLAHVDRLMAYATPDEHAELALYLESGFVELTTTKRGWRRATRT